MVSKRILVTGGAGFLGSHLCERLLASGHEVICLDNFFTSQKLNIKHILNHENFELIRHDIIDPINLVVDEIYNLACPAAPGHYQYDPVRTLKTSILGAMNVLDLANKCNAKVLQASTSEVYGDPSISPQDEEYRGSVNITGPRACYDEGKRVAESLFTDYWRKYETRIRIARIFNTYGPRMHPFDGRVISNFIRQALYSDTVTIYGDGYQTRSFCYVDDLIDGLIRLMDSDITQPINLGNPIEFSIKTLAFKLKTLLEKDLRLEFKDLPVDDPKQRCPDIKLARLLLHWEPKIYLKDGLKRTIAWFKSINISDFRPPTPNY